MAVEDDCHRAVVDELNVHRGAELTVSTLTPRIRASERKWS